MLSRVYSHRGASAARLLLSFLAVVALTAAVVAQEPQLTPPTGADPEGVETLTQGPIHEAFANPTDLDPTPGPIVMRQPPPDIQEEPPEYMPEDSAWIGGYWAFDDERDDFIWVTGVARKIPPGMRYMPGYWSEVDGGWQRVSGFWMSADAGEVAYRPAPPDSLEAGPSSPAPADNYFWVPGNWIYYDTGYRWRAGYWSPYQPDWVWCPARWVWTPGGFVYLPGFWDFRLALRGEFFAPIYFSQPVYLQPRFVYRPWCVIPTSNLFIHLWIRPQHSHYYFGNYYGPRYANIGFHAWCDLPRQRRHYDPLFTYVNVHYRRQGVDFVGRVQGWHEHFDQHEEHRPARTWREQVVQRQQPRAQLETQLVAKNIVEVAERNEAPVRLTKLDNQTRQALSQRSQQLRELNTSRKQIEREGAQVVAKLPKASDAAVPERTTPEVRGKGAPAAKSRTEVARLPAGSANLPKLKLPKDPLADVRAAAPTGPAESKGKVAAKGAGELAGPRGKVARRDNVPPPMPAEDDSSAKAKGRPAPQPLPSVADTDETPPAKGKTEPRSKGRPQPPVELPADRLPTVVPPTDRLPKRGDDAPPVDSGKGKGAPSKGQPRKAELPRIELQPDTTAPPRSKGGSPKVESAPRIEVPKNLPRVETSRASDAVKGKKGLDTSPLETAPPKAAAPAPRSESPKNLPRIETPRGTEGSKGKKARELPPPEQTPPPAARIEPKSPRKSSSEARSAQGRGKSDKK